jgi:hypothetical protein
MELFPLQARPLSVSRYLTWMAVAVLSTAERAPSNLAISTCPFALIILLYAFLLATGADTSSFYKSLLIPKSK